MMRVLYRMVLWLHPPAFRSAYRDEMLWIFDQTVADNGAGGLFADAMTSVLRQWFLRSRVWMVPVALAGALFTMLAGNALLHFAFRRLVAITADTPEERFVVTATVSVVTVAFAVLATVVCAPGQSKVRPTRRHA
jgi:hypothetical protein